MHFPLITYSSGVVNIDDISIPNSFLKERYEEYCFDDTVKTFKYQNANKDNYILYKDGTSEKLELVVPKYEKLIDDRYFVEFYYNEKIKKERFVEESSKVIIYIGDLYQKDITEKEKEDLYNKYLKQNRLTEIPKEDMLEVLEKIKLYKLKESDWSQLPDVQSSFTEEEKQAWIDYRATLRSLDETDDPYNVTVPKSPEEK
jgi:hypothetical protein